MAEEDAKLAALEAHGLAFLQSFGITSLPSVKRTQDEPTSNRPSKKRRKREPSNEEESEDGAASSSAATPAKPVQSAPITRRQPDVVVFSQAQYTKSEPKSKASQRSFMSSKISRVVQDPESATLGTSSTDPQNPDDELDRSNVKNDSELYRLLHTRLLSTPLNPELATSSAQQKKALAGRVLELADRSKLGKGEKDVRTAERKKASLHVRIGMKEKQKSRDAKQLDEAKNVGNYHPALKKLFAPSSDESKPAPKRERGLSMGVGRHTSSGLKISKEDIERVNGSSSSSSGRGRGGFGGRGRGGKTRGKRR